ncbi:hypothetical protein OIDMADRAFT_101825 [Oidiodendron maius Zn]|uniref:Adenosine deaminase domain-containing protein n=1 Tax=Oidiodendron maius (strain Zn) TaxID=913774 RepID=A0A0C3D132_OIDMZ|nr:hypothetical protein OIDMADRAFT_101825 [Oidiodendron maius Zn]
MEETEQPLDFQALPKIELHAHLSGSISRECLHEVWVQKRERGETTLEDPLIVMPQGKFDYNLETFFPLFSKYIYALCNDIPSLTYTTTSVLEAFHADGVVYLELRTTPRAIPSANLTSEDYVRTILSCIAAFNTTHTSMRTSLLLSIDRRHSLPTALAIVSLASTLRTSGVVGIDLCGDPSVGEISSLVPAFHAARAQGLPCTLHFAEAPQSSSPEELQTLLSFAPERLGHVIHVPEDVRGEIERRKLGLELCLSCNVHAGMVVGGFGEHHFGWWWRRGCPIALSTDDVGVFGSSLSNEYALVAKHFGLNRRDICELARSPIEAIFGSEEDKNWLRKRMWV